MKLAAKTGCREYDPQPVRPAHRSQPNLSEAVEFWRQMGHGIEWMNAVGLGS